MNHCAALWPRNEAVKSGISGSDWGLHTSCRFRWTSVDLSVFLCFSVNSTWMKMPWRQSPGWLWREKLEHVASDPSWYVCFCLFCLFFLPVVLKLTGSNSESTYLLFLNRKSSSWSPCLKCRTLTSWLSSWTKMSSKEKPNPDTSGRCCSANRTGCCLCVTCQRSDSVEFCPVKTWTGVSVWISELQPRSLQRRNTTQALRRRTGLGRRTPPTTELRVAHVAERQSLKSLVYLWRPALGFMPAPWQIRVSCGLCIRGNEGCWFSLRSVFIRSKLRVKVCNYLRSNTSDVHFLAVHQQGGPLYNISISGDC